MGRFTGSHLLKSFVGSRKTGDGFIEFDRIDPHELTNPLGSRKIHQIVLSKHSQRQITFVGRKVGHPVLNIMIRQSVGLLPNGVLRSGNKTGQHSILLIIHHGASGDNGIEVQCKLILIAGFGRKNIDMIPRNPRD